MGGATGGGGSGASDTGGATSAGGAGGGGGAGGSMGTGGSVGTGGTARDGGGATAGGGGGGGTGGAAGTGGAGTGGSVGTGGTSSNGGADAGTTPSVHLDQAQQRMDGFGMNNVFASAMTDATADRLFSTTTGIGLSILRVGMASNGTTLGSDTAGDIAKAKARGVTYVIGSVWSPPANCKTAVVLTGMQPPAVMTENGGHLSMSCYDSWSTSIANFARTNGLYAMSIANEPDFQSCGTAEPCNGYYPTTLYTANEMVAFVKIAAPKLRAAGVKVMAPEASEWVHLWSNTSAAGSQPSNLNSSDPLQCGFPATSATCASGGGYDYGHYLFKDSTAWAAVDLLGVHQYDTQVALPWPDDVTDRKPLWETEMSGVKWWAEQGPSSDINDGLVVAGWIHDAIVNGPASAWLWWWYQAQGTNDNEGLLLQNGTVAKRLWVLGNFSKFVRPNYMRVSISGTVPTDVLLTAYKGADGTIVVVAINRGTASATVPIVIAGGAAPATLTPWVTSATDDLASKTAIAVTGGSFTATLASKTVTTFVGK